MDFNDFVSSTFSFTVHRCLCFGGSSLGLRFAIHLVHSLQKCEHSLLYSHNHNLNLIHCRFLEKRTIIRSHDSILHGFNVNVFHKWYAVDIPVTGSRLEKHTTTYASNKQKIRPKTIIAECKHTHCIR
jgi:hypothetical protein